MAHFSYSTDADSLSRRYRYPADKHSRVVQEIDKAPRHRGEIIDEALARNPHLGFYRLPRYSPWLNPVGRFWREPRRRAAHNRRSDAPAYLRRSVRTSPCNFQTGGRERVAFPPVRGCYPTSPNATASPNS